MPAGRKLSGALVRSRYDYTIPGDPGRADPDRHRIDEGHLVDSSGRDEAPRGGGWAPMEYYAVQQPLPGGSPDGFVESHRLRTGHRVDDGGGSASARSPGPLVRFIWGMFPPRPNAPADLVNAGASGAAHGGQGYRGMDPSNVAGRRTVDGRYTTGGTALGHKYTHPIDRRRTPLHFNRPTIRRILAPSITRERGGASPGGYSSQYDPSVSSWSAGPRQPSLRRLIRPFGQVSYDDVSQSPDNARRANPGPIGNGGW